MKSKSLTPMFPEAAQNFSWHYLKSFGEYDLAKIILPEHPAPGHQEAKMLTRNKRKCQLCFLLLVEGSCDSGTNLDLTEVFAINYLKI